ncbi:uncharacterized protein [Watersipora subatra]|uniref:uncharacterized protein isoform X2 n=1 Tax=Watersipora subatra TaxID=2589382 RepID=UPI00355B0D3A
MLKRGRMGSIILAGLLLLSSAQLSNAQASLPSPVDAVGTEFTIFFQENAARRPDFTFELQLFLTTHHPTPVTVIVRLPLISENGVEMKQEVIVNKGNVTEVNFPQTMMHVGSSISNKGIHILATAPIVVYGVNPQRFSSEGFIAIPNHLLGTEYYAVGMPAEDQHSQLGAVAVEGGSTEITITLPDVVGLRVDFQGRTYGANDVVVASLSQYQSVQLQHRNTRKSVPQGDLSGARIQCSKRCAAFSGNSRTSVSGDSRDLLVEQLPPVSTWGREFAVPPTPGRTDRPDILKIVCQQRGTIVLVDGFPHPCDAGGSIQLEISTAAPHFVTATKPVMAATVVMSQNGNNALIQADPAMTLIIPEEQYAQAYTIATATWSGAATDGQAYDNYLTVVVRRDRIDSVILDGVNVNTAYPNTMWKDVPSTAVGGKPALVTAYFNITSGTHTISTLLDDTRFMCIVYGAGDRESYAYMGGMRLQVINPACTQVLQLPTAYGDGIDNDCDARIDEELCDGEDDDQDGSIDEDCAVRNEVKARGDVSVFVGQTATLRWTVYATDYTNFNQLRLYKQQATAAEVLLAEGQRSLVLTELFDGTGRHNVTVSNVVRKGELDVVEVELTIISSSTVDPGDYRLEYTAQNGLFDASNQLSVQQRNQHYEIIARDLETGSTQYARSTQPEPRNLYFQEGKNYSITFHSIGGQHLDDLPYRQYIDGVEVTGNFQVVGLKEDYVTGSVTGLQDVQTVYELFLESWTANSSFDKKVVSVKNADIATVDSAILNIDSSLIRPSISCRFEPTGNETGRVVCDITNVKVDITDLYWTFDGTNELRSPGRADPYVTTHSASNGNSEVYAAVFDGIHADQWPDNSNTRLFRLTLTQSNGYTLNADTYVSLSELPNAIRVGSVDGVLSVDYQNGVATIDAVVRGGSPPPNEFQWRVQQDDGTFETYPAGRGDSTNVTMNRDGHPTSTLTINGLSARKTLSFLTSSVRDGRTVWTAEKSWIIEPITPTATPGQVTGTITEATDGSVVLVATVTGGQPAADSFNWTLADGSVLFPGQTRGSVVASQAENHGNGSVTFYLTLGEGRTASPQTIIFRTASGQRWFASFTYNLSPTSQLPPSVACGLRTTNLRIGDEVEIVCTVQPTPRPGLTHTINDLIYTNFPATGSERNISSSTSHPLFRYEEKTNSDGTITASLYFTLTENFEDLKNYFFTVDYVGGVSITTIRLDDVFQSIANRPEKTYIVGVESQVISLTCSVQAASNSLAGLRWIRRSLGPSGREQMVFTDGQIQEPFRGTGRYVESNMVTADDLLKSTLTITNLQRTDIAEYACVLGSGSVAGEFVLDVIGSTFLVDNQIFNNQLTPVSDSDLYDLQFVFESVSISDYLVKYGGVAESLAVRSRNATRYDSFAQEAVPVQVITLFDGSFSPRDVFVIQTYYLNPENSAQVKIDDYVLTKKTGSSNNQTDSIAFVYIRVNNQEFGADETLSLISNLPVSLSVRVSAPTCSQEIRVLIDSADVTSEFIRTTEVSGSSCIITFTRENYIGDGDQTIQTIAVTGNGNIILSENSIQVQNVLPATTTTPPPLNDKTGSCSDRNGGCHHTCVTDSPSSFHCECASGFALQADERICLDINECLTNNGGCDYICQNTKGSFTCGCEPGLRLSANSRSCIDENECDRNPCLSTERCINTFGSYTCLQVCECPTSGI